MKLNMTVEEFLQSWSPSDDGYYPLDAYQLEEKERVLRLFGLTEEEMKTDPCIKECIDGYVASADGIESICPGIEWKGFRYYTNQWGEYCIRKVIDYSKYVYEDVC